MTIRNKNNNVPQAGRTGGPKSRTDDPSVCLKDSGGGSPIMKIKKPIMTTLRVSTYNVKTLLSDDRLDQLQIELAKIQWDIVGLAEVRRRGENLMCLPSGHTLYYKGQEQISQAGVGFIINSKWSPNVLQFKGISERVAFLTLKINKRTEMKIIQVYFRLRRRRDRTIL